MICLEKNVTPILLYGCEIWGFSKLDIIEKVHLKFCKLSLNLKKVHLVIYDLWRIRYFTYVTFCKM